MKFVDQNNIPLGILTFYAVHCHSIDNTNQLVNSDNKGYASYLFEKKMKDINPNFIAIFAQSNEGDSSSNTKGGCCNWEYKDGKYTCPHKCDLIGNKCYHCTGHIGDCNNNPFECVGKGHGICPEDDLEDCRHDYMNAMKIGRDQYEFALKLFNDNKYELQGKIQFAHNLTYLVDKEIDPDFLPCRNENEKWCNNNLNI